MEGPLSNPWVVSSVLLACIGWLLKLMVTDKLRVITEWQAKNDRRHEELSGQVHTVQIAQTKQAGKITGLEKDVRFLQQQRWGLVPPSAESVE